MKKSFIFPLGIAALGIVLVLGFSAFKLDATLGKNKFIENVTVAGTRVHLTFPKNGFYGHGIHVMNQVPEGPQGVLGAFHLETTDAYDAERGSEFVIMDVRVLARGPEDNSIEDIVKKVTNGTMEEEYAKTGKTITINQRDYFIYKMAEDATIWKAVHLDQEIVIVSLAYTSTDAAQSRLAYQNNDELFKKILEGISFEETMSYESKRLKFAVDYPAKLNVSEETGNTVSFRTSTEEPWMVSISAEKTSLASTQEWLNAQPKGSAASAGFETILWLGRSPDGKVIVAEYVVVDRDGNKPIYGKTLSAVLVQNGMLYKIKFRNQFKADEAPVIDPELLNIITSFRTYPDL